MKQYLYLPAVIIAATAVTACSAEEEKPGDLSGTHDRKRTNAQSGIMQAGSWARRS